MQSLLIPFLSVLIALLLGVLVSIGAYALARSDGATRPASLARAGCAFGATLTILIALSALVVTTVG